MALPNNKIKILNCAEKVVLRDGVAHLTLDAVAAEAGLSKGGILYHYPTKDELIRGMLQRLMDQADTDMARLEEADPEPVGRLMRAYLAVSFPEPDSEHHHCDQVAAALLAAILTNPALLEPLRVRFREMQARLVQDGLDEVRIHVIRTAADGLWMAEILGMPGPDPEVRNKVIEQLYQMTRK